MALSFGQLISGAGDVARGMETQRSSRQQNEEQAFRLAALRRQEEINRGLAQLPLEEQSGARLNIPAPMDVREILAPSPAAATTPSPQTQAAAAQPDIPYGQQVQNPNYVPPRDDPLRAQAQTQIDQHNARIKDLENSIANMVVTPGMSRDQIAQINRARLTHFGQIEAEKQKRAQAEAVLNRTSPTIDYGREGRSQMIAQAQPQARLAAAQQYDTAKTNYDDLMAKSAQANGIDPVIFKRLIGTESSFRPDAVSPRGEKFGLGIAQIAAVHGLTREQMLDPAVAIPFAAKLFAQYLKEANGNYEQALYRYKGATSDQGRAAMAGPIVTILSGTAAAPVAAAAPAAPAAPTAPTQVAQAPVGTGVTPQDVKELASPNASVAMKAFLDKDYNEAYRQWRKTPDAAESKYGMGRLLYEGLGDKPNKEKGLRLLNEAAQQGYAPATSFLARITQPTQLAQAPTGTMTDAPKAGLNVATGGDAVKKIIKPVNRYLANPEFITPDMQNALGTRQELVRLAQVYQQAGAGLEYMKVREQIRQLDQGMYYLQGMQGLAEFTPEFGYDSRRLAAVMTHYAGRPVQFRPRSDGLYDVYVNGELSLEAQDPDEISKRVRNSFDTEYRKSQAAAGAKRSEKIFDTMLEIQKGNALEMAKMISSIRVEQTKGNNQLALEWGKANFGWDIKPTGAGDGTVIIRPPNSPPYLFNPSTREIDVDGVKVKSNGAVLISGLPAPTQARLNAIQ